MIPIADGQDLRHVALPGAFGVWNATKQQWAHLGGYWFDRMKATKAAMALASKFPRNRYSVEDRSSGANPGKVVMGQAVPKLASPAEPEASEKSVIPSDWRQWRNVGMKANECPCGIVRVQCDYHNGKKK